MGVMLIQILEFFFTRRPNLSRRTAERLVDLLMPFSQPGHSTIPVGKEKEAGYEDNSSIGGDGGNARAAFWPAWHRMRTSRYGRGCSGACAQPNPEMLVALEEQEELKGTIKEVRSRLSPRSLFKGTV